MSNQSNNTKLKEHILEIAVLGKAVGLKGEMKFHDKSDFPEQFKVGATFTTNKKSKVTIKSINKTRSTLMLEGVNSVEEAKRLTNVKLLSSEEESRKNCSLEDHQFFYFDIEGCEVFEGEESLGVVDEVERLGETDYLVITTNEELVKKGLSKSFLVPYVGFYIVEVDIESKEIDVEGAKELLEAS